MAGTSIGDLFLRIRATAAGLAADISRDLRSAQGTLTSQSVAMGTLIADGIKKGISVTGSFFKEQIQTASRLSMEMETTTTLFGVLLGSAEKAKKAIAEIRVLDQQSPLNFSTLTQSGQLLLAMGEDASKLTEDLRILGTVALGNSERMGRLGYAFGQIQSLGRLAGTELRQLTELGFNPLKNISARTGESITKLTKRMSDGKIAAAEMRLAMIDSVMEGGTFFGALERMEQTLAGKLAKLEGSYQTLMVGIGNGINASLKPVVEAMVADLGKLKPAAEMIGQGLGQWIGAVYEWAGGFRGVLGWVIDIGITISEWMPRISALGSFFYNAFKGLMNGAQAAGGIFVSSLLIMKEGANTFFQFLKLKWDQLKAWARETAYNIKTWFIEVFNSIIQVINDLPGQIQDVMKSLPVPDWVKEGTVNAAKTIRKGVSSVVKNMAGPGGYGEPELPQGEAQIDDTLIPPINLPVHPDFQIDESEYRNSVETLKVITQNAGQSLREPIEGIVEAANGSAAALSKLFSEDTGSSAMVDTLENLKKEIASVPDVSAAAAQQTQVDMKAIQAQAIREADAGRKALADSDDKAAKAAAKASKKARTEFLRDFVNQYEDIQRVNEQTYESFRAMNRDVVTDIVSSWATGTAKISDIVSQWANQMIKQFIALSLFGNKSAGGSISGLLGAVGGLFGSTSAPASTTAGAAAANSYTGAGSTGGWISAAASLIGGFFADGGRPPMGKISVVGERGPELFVPDSAGRIIPNHQAAASAAPVSGGGGGQGGGAHIESPVIVNFNQTFTTGVTMADLAGAMDQVQDSARSGVLEAVRRGGGYRKGMQS